MSVWRDAKAAYENYLSAEKKHATAMKEAKDIYSAKKLVEIERTANYGLQKSREVMNNQLAVLRNRYEEQLMKADDYTALDSAEMASLGRLGSLLHSGITFSRQEYSRMAQKYGTNRACSRLLHDEAKKSGFTLDNMTDAETKLNKFEWMIDRYSKAAELTDDLQRSFLLDFDPVEIEKKLECPSYTCTDTPTDWDSLGRSIGQSMSISGGATPASFLVGFLGEDKAQALAEVEQLASEPERVRFDAMDETAQAFVMNLNRLGGDYKDLSFCMDKVEDLISDIQKAKAKQNG